jgi:predicted glutamine amidotransferase
MCRWLAYHGSPLHLEELILRPRHSLIDQSLHSERGAETTNGDGFGVGWYGDRLVPGRFRSVHPAWNDKNLRDLVQHIASPLFLAHVRAATSGPIQETNCHPFRYRRWLFVHNGLIREHHRLRRELLLEVDHSFFGDIEGTTDSELMFFLALTFGLEDDPLPALERMAGLVEALGRSNDVEYPIQMSLGLADGDRLYAVRYSSEGKSRTLYHTADVKAVKKLHPDRPRLQRLPDDVVAFVSEPLMDLEDAWVEVPESSAVIAEASRVEVRPFRPLAPA